MIGVGDKVVCINDDWGKYNLQWELSKGVSFPVKNIIYTVRKMYTRSDDIFITLIEIVNPPLHYSDGYGEAAFIINQFRPVKKTKTDISIFQNIDRDVFSKGKIDA